MMPLLLQNETELQKLNNRLLELSNDITEELIMKGALECTQSYVTVKRYINGHAKKEAVAKKLIEFFESQLQLS
jgi:hypothetical protein